ncbi:MAG: V-type ATPase subunit [Synergistaceae bacterium]|nr:V-type ATPase subunit [Synergistaceae bacterium]
MSYVYAVARLRSMENRFLDTSFFSRLIDSATLDDALKSLGETVYAQWAAGASDAGFDRLIDSELLATCDDLKRFVPDKELVDLCRMPYDFNNVKVILKSLFKVREGGERRYDLLSKLGAVDTERLITALEGEEYGFLPYCLGDVVPQCWALWDQTKDPRRVEVLLDERLFAAMLELARGLEEKLKNDAVTRWVEHKIDAENLRNAVRLRRMGYDFAAASPFFHKGGTIGPDDVAKLMGEPLESWGKALSHTGIGAALEVSQDRVDAQVTLSEISKALDGYLIRVLEKAKYSASAPENVILYLLRKEEEARNLRIALVCVANGLNREFARRLLSHGR